MACVCHPKPRQHAAQQGDLDEKIRARQSFAKTKLAPEFTVKFKGRQRLAALHAPAGCDGYARSRARTAFLRARLPKTNEAWSRIATPWSA